MRIKENRVKALASTIDFMLNLVGTIKESLESFYNHFLLLPEGNIQDVLEVIVGCENALVVFNEINPGAMTKEDKAKESLDLHSALAYTYKDSFSLFRHSLLSASTGYYTVAYVELRSMMEGYVRGLVFDLLSYPEFRENSRKIREVSGIDEQSTGFSELIDILNDKYGSERIAVSAEIFDLIEEKLKNFNPKTSLGTLLSQF